MRIDPTAGPPQGPATAAPPPAPFAPAPPAAPPPVLVAQAGTGGALSAEDRRIVRLAIAEPPVSASDTTWPQRADTALAILERMGPERLAEMVRDPRAASGFGEGETFQIFAYLGEASYVDPISRRIAEGTAPGNGALIEELEGRANALLDGIGTATAANHGGTTANALHSIGLAFTGNADAVRAENHPERHLDSWREATARGIATERVLDAFLDARIGPGDAPSLRGVTETFARRAAARGETLLGDPDRAAQAPAAISAAGAVLVELLSRTEDDGAPPGGATIDAVMGAIRGRAGSRLTNEMAERLTGPAGIYVDADRAATILGQVGGIANDEPKAQFVEGLMLGVPEPEALEAAEGLVPEGASYLAVNGLMSLLVDDATRTLNALRIEDGRSARNVVNPGGDALAGFLEKYLAYSQGSVDPGAVDLPASVRETVDYEGLFALMEVLTGGMGRDVPAEERIEDDFRKFLGEVRDPDDPGGYVPDPAGAAPFDNPDGPGNFANAAARGYLAAAFGRGVERAIEDRTIPSEALLGRFASEAIGDAVAMIPGITPRRGGRIVRGLAQQAAKIFRNFTTGEVKRAAQGGAQRAFDRGYIDEVTDAASLSRWMTNALTPPASPDAADTYLGPGMNGGVDGSDVVPDAYRVFVDAQRAEEAKGG